MVHEALGLVPSSHVAIFSRAAHDFFQRELKGIDSITAGFFLQQYPGGFFVSEVMTGGPADAAGLARGDRVVALDGVPVADSPRLDGRSDDAHLPDRPTHLVLGEEGETLRVEVRRRGGSDATGRDVKQEISITVASYSSLRGDRGSARIIEREEKRLGYVRLSYMYSYDTSRLLRPLLEETFSTCDGLLLDLRGRGGSPIAMWALMQMTKGPKAIWTRPMILLVDTETRSAKEVFADWFKHHKDGASGPRLVGEKTIGAARGGALHPIGEEFFLLCPSQPFARPTGLERKGVTPDVLVVVERPRQLAEDPILVRGLEVLEQAIAAPSARAAPAVPQGAATRPASQPR